MKEKKEGLARQLRIDHAEDEYIESLILFSMKDSDACWQTVGEVTEGLKKLKFKKDKLAALKDTILIRVKGYGHE